MVQPSSRILSMAAFGAEYTLPIVEVDGAGFSITTEVCPKATVGRRKADQKKAQ